jgi:large repetitive protein
MSKLIKVSFKVLDLLVIFMMVFGSPMTVLAAPQAQDAAPPTIQSDLADYPPGATVTLTGTGWAVGETVHIVVNDTIGQSWQHVNDVTSADGTIIDVFSLPSYFVSNYDVTATGPTSGSATTTFTDLSIGTYDQCSNDTGTGYPSGDTGCRWINGNLQSNNSIYFEGDATVQRVWLTGFVPGTTHTVTLKYGTTKGGKHAYDFLTTWDWSEDWITVADRCQDITGCTTASETILDIPEDPNAPNSFEPSAPGDRVFTMRGGTLSSATTPAVVSGSYAGDSETVTTVTFKVASSGNMCPTSGPDTGTCGVALWFGAHVAAQANWGLGLGAGSISGSPYHVALDAIDGASVGQRDNQMQANVVTAVPNGTLIIIKDAQPNDAQDFNFSLSSSTIDQNFSLDDDNDPTLPNTTAPQYSLPPGTYTVQEINIPTGWTLTKLVCVDPTSNSSVSGAVATVNLVSNETVTCTYTDTKEPDKLDLTVSKNATPSFIRTYHWGISKNVDKTEVDIADGGSATFNYQVDVTHDNGTNSGWQVTGQITVNNPNAFSVSGVSVTDSIDPNATCSVTGGSSTIAANSSATFNYTCTYSAAPAASSQTNTATASWTPFGSPNNSASGTASVNWSPVTPTLVDETVSVSDPNAPNPPFPATVTYTDPSPKSFTYSKTFTGDPAGACTSHNNTATFTTNDTGATGSAGQTVKVCVGKDLIVSKTAVGTFDRTYLWKISKNVDKTTVNIADGGTATFNYTVDVEQTGITNSGWTLAGKITISNPNDWEAITLTSLGDSVDNGGTCSVDPGPYVVPKSGSLDVNYSCTYSLASDLTGTNTATATWDAAKFFTPTGTASGQKAFTLAQSGATNQTITVTDTFGGTLGTLTASDTAPFTTHSYTYSHDFAGVGGTCTTYNNTAEITETKQSASQSVTVCVGKDLTASKTATGSYNRTYLWDIKKNVDKTTVKIADGGSATFNYTVDVTETGITDAGWTLSGKITITNPNDWEAITLTSLGDSVDNGGSCSVDPGPYVVPKSGSLDVNYTCTYGSAPSSYSGTNTATAAWDKAAFFTPTGTASGSAGFTLSQGGSTNKTVHVIDTFGGNLGTVTATDSTPFASNSFTYSRTVSGVTGTCTNYDNTATITETNQSSSKTVTVCVAKDLTVSKTASGTYDRSYLWQISKDVDKTAVKMGSGGTATFNYTVLVEQTGVTDAGWNLSGKITILNPNDWEDITLTGLSDTVDNGGACTVDAGPYTVLAGKSLEVNYNCSYGSAPSSYSGTNSATATWDKTAAFTPTGSASGSAPFTLSQAGTTNKTVTVTDTLGGTLGTVTATDPPAAPASESFTYSHDFTGVSGTCTNYDNTAKITETNQTASKTVTVCVGADLTVSKTATPTFTRTFTWNISKDVDQSQINVAGNGNATFNYTVRVRHDAGTDSAWMVTGKITVSNPNDWEAITVDVADTVSNGGSCTVTSGTGVSIPASGSQTFDYTCTYASAPTKANGLNSATATWDKDAAFTPSGSATGIASFSFNTPTTLVDETVNVTDPQAPNPPLPATVSYTDPSPTLFNYAITFPGVGGTCKTYDNTATFTTNDTGTTGSASQIVKVCASLDLTVSKTATPTFIRTYHWGISKSADKTQINIAEGGTATFIYTVAVTHDNGTDSGWKVTGKITVSNPNDWEDIVANVTDALDTGACTVTGGSNVNVPKSGSVTLDYTCDPASANATKNTATAAWDKETYSTPSGSASGSADVAFTAPTTIVDGTLSVSDTLGGSLGTVSYTDPSPKLFTYPYTFSGDTAGTCTNHNNTATFTTNSTGTTSSASQTVKVCVGKDLTVSKTAAGTFDRTYLWQISKDVDKTSVKIADGGSYTFHYTVNVAQTGISDSGWTLSGKITVSNPNDWEAITVNVSDAVDNGGSCTVTGGTGVSIPASGSKTFDYSCSYATKPASYSGTNTATATWDKTAAYTPSGTASGSAGFTLSQLGSTNKTVYVTDSFAGDLGTVTATDSTPFATASFTYDRTESGVSGKCTTYNNTATITETGQSASASATLCVAKDPTVSKTATPTFKRSYLWDISKSVDKTLVRQNGGSVTFNYTVVVKETGFTDSNWSVTGAITVTNPNDWEAITVNVSDAVDNGGTCTVTGGTSVSVPTSGTKTFNYSCTWASAPSNANGVNTVTASWDKAAYYTPNGSASGTANFIFNTPTTEVNKTVAVTDTFNGTTTTLGTVTAISTTPYTTKTFTYPHTVNVPAAGCQDYPNTAKIVETGQTASAKVTVCRPSLVTNSQLCTVPNNQWRLVFTPDVNQSNGYKLNASNPGQTFYNIFYSGAGNEDITITLPYPYVTQGATPIHVYSNVSVSTSGGITCLTPSGELANENDQITLANYTPQAMGSTTTVTIHVPALSGGFAYINIHLDYGLKGTTGYLKGGPSGNDAVDKTNTSIVRVPDLQTYAFSDTAGGSYTVSTTNVFKKNPGIGGKGNKTLTRDPVATNTKVVITDANKKTVATLYTDEDGWYMWSYKYTGKATTFNITMSGITKSITLKSNAYVEVDFDLP